MRTCCFSLTQQLGHQVFQPARGRPGLNPRFLCPPETTALVVTSLCVWQEVALVPMGYFTTQWRKPGVLPPGHEMCPAQQTIELLQCWHPSALRRVKRNRQEGARLRTPNTPELGCSPGSGGTASQPRHEPPFPE